MTVLAIVGYVVGVLGIVCAARFYYELWKWAKQCQHAEIAIAHNRRVQLRGPLTEWLSWANALSGDESATGRVVYRNGKVSVAILRPRRVSKPRAAIMRVRNSRTRKRAPAPGTPGKVTATRAR